MEMKMMTRRKIRGRRIWPIIVVILLVVVGVAAAAGGSYWIKISKAQEQARVNTGIPSSETAISSAQDLNVLVLGVDNGKLINEYRPGSGRSDTMMLFAYRPLEKKIYQVSIPRDSRVAISGYGMTKINAAYAYGGAQLAQQTVEDLLGVKIDRVAVINYSSFVQLVDAIGGVTIDVEKDINTRYNMVIPIPTGHVKLTGEQAFRYVHARNSDTERVQRQQKFVRAVFDQIKTDHAFLTVFQYLISHPDAFSTNISAGEMLRFSKLATSLDDYQVQTVLADGSGQYIDKISYWILDEDKLQQIKELLAE
jgi:LCP family protein required for cell wall assembly